MPGEEQVTNDAESQQGKQEEQECADTCSHRYSPTYGSSMADADESLQQVLRPV